jgi:hypothetical protein
MEEFKKSHGKRKCIPRDTASLCKRAACVNFRRSAEKCSKCPTPAQRKANEKNETAARLLPGLRSDNKDLLKENEGLKKEAVQCDEEVRELEAALKEARRNSNHDVEIDPAASPQSRGVDVVGSHAKIFATFFNSVSKTNGDSVQTIAGALGHQQANNATPQKQREYSLDDLRALGVIPSTPK